MVIKGTIIIDKVIITTDLLITSLRITNIGRIMSIIIITSLEECTTLMPAEGEAEDHITRVAEVSIITITIEVIVTEMNTNQVIDPTGVIVVKIIGQPLETQKYTIIGMGQGPRNQTHQPHRTGTQTMVTCL